MATKKNKVKNVDFLWLDMQGYELPALKSASKLLKNVKVIYAEACFVEAYKKKKQEVASWEADGNVSVKAFYEQYVRYLDQMIENMHDLTDIYEKQLCSLNTAHQI